jgi:hypothetical protein
MGTDVHDLAVTLAVNAFIVAYLFFAWSWDLPPGSPLRKLLNPLRAPVAWAGVWHTWSMFAPDPLSTNELIVADIHLADGRLLRWEQARLEHVSFWDAFLSMREQKFLASMTASGGAYDFLWPALGEFVARDAVAQGYAPVRVVLKLRFCPIPPPSQADGPEEWAEQDVYVCTVRGGLDHALCDR